MVRRRGSARPPETLLEMKLTYMFIALAMLSWIGFCLQAQRNNFSGMVYAIAMVIAWALAAQWWTS